MGSKITTLRSILPSCFKPKESDQRLSFSDKSSLGSEVSTSDLSSSLIGSSLQVFTLDELKAITNNFSRSGNEIGVGGFGTVYKGLITDQFRVGLKAQTVAVKVLDFKGTHGHQQWLEEVVFIGQLRHPHLVNLVGYCENKKRVLVYEYMARGDLDNQLFGRCSVALPWLTRMKIAVGAAKGLTFLHGANKPIIFRNLKASNVLLDSLSDFGFAREIDYCILSGRISCTRGYDAPEYLMTEQLTMMSDVYSFGVVLLELLTGRRCVDVRRPRKEQFLVDWARPLLKNPKKIDLVMEPRLDGEYSSQGARFAATLAYRCLKHRPQSRPVMSSVVKTLELVIEMKDILTHVVCVHPKIDTLLHATD